MWPIPQDSPDGLSLLDGDIECLWLGVKGRVLEADVANSWRVNEWHKLLNVVDQDAVEEINIRLLEGGEVEVFVDWSRAGVDHLHRTSDLSRHRLHDMWNEAGEVLVYTIFWGEGSAYERRMLAMARQK